MVTLLGRHWETIQTHVCRQLVAPQHRPVTWICGSGCLLFWFFFVWADDEQSVIEDGVKGLFRADPRP
jgi:hypothetical protein